MQGGLYHKAKNRLNAHFLFLFESCHLDEKIMALEKKLHTGLFTPYDNPPPPFALKLVNCKREMLAVDVQPEDVGRILGAQS